MWLFIMLTSTARDFSDLFFFRIYVLRIQPILDSRNVWCIKITYASHSTLIYHKDN